MDPVLALALACNVLQVVDLSLGAARACMDIYERGSLSENDEVENFTTELRRLNLELDQQLSSTKLSAGDLRIKKLAVEASQVASEVDNIVRELKLIGKQDNGRVLLQAIKTLSKRRPIAKLVQKLETQDKITNY